MRYISMFMFFCGAVTSLHAGWNQPPKNLANTTSPGPVGIAHTPSSDIIITLAGNVGGFGLSPYYVLVHPNGSTQGTTIFPGQHCNDVVLPIFCPGPTTTLNKTLITFSDPVGTVNIPTFTTYDGTSFTSAAPIYPSHLQGADPLSPIWPSYDSSTGTALVVWLDTTTSPHHPIYSTSTDLVTWSHPFYIPGLPDVTYLPYVTATTDNNGSFFVCMSTNAGAIYAILGSGTNTVDATHIPNSTNASNWVVPAYHAPTNTYIITWVDASSHFPTYTIYDPSLTDPWSTPSPIPPLSPAYKANPSSPITSAVDNNSGHILFGWVNPSGFLYSIEYDAFLNAVQVQPQQSITYPFMLATAYRTWHLTSVSPTGQPYVIQGTGPFFPTTFTTTTVKSAPNPSKFTETVTIKAVVSPSDVTGKVIFRANGKIIGGAQLVNGVARFTTCTLPRGRNTITATFRGDAQHSGSSGMTLQIVH